MIARLYFSTEIPLAEGNLNRAGVRQSHAHGSSFSNRLLLFALVDAPIWVLSRTLVAASRRPVSSQLTARVLLEQRRCRVNHGHKGDEIQATL